MDRGGQRTLEEVRQATERKVLRPSGEKKEIMCTKAYWSLKRLEDGDRGEDNGSIRSADGGR